ncbi:MAG: hypothetical protein Q8922_07230 [Bacteroidota bacterium]|nr:hypothetical protein [Bacteroidota bacterium]MDP4233982.1 hypothetical protein [Bacteroidota bacterium]MDP4242849.1 hypothetical protein [Bacteroidota bacterium]MDP4287713.1 hypothetical protein [Bacteroidota bacterium]
MMKSDSFSHCKCVVFVAVMVCCSLGIGGRTLAQEANVKNMSLGMVFGDPLGATMQYRTTPVTALDVGFGPDYFGSPRLQVDYVWKFNTFHSSVLNTYAGPGLAVAFAKGIRIFYSKEPKLESFANLEDNKFGFGGRAIFGLNYARALSPFQFFVEGGPVVAASHIFDLDYDGAIGFRYKI